MPCESYGYERRGGYGFSEREVIANHKKEMDKMAQMLCACCRQIEQSLKSVPDSVYDWWTSHKRKDDERIAAENRQRETTRKKLEALGKLTKEEQDILGLSVKNLRGW